MTRHALLLTAILLAAFTAPSYSDSARDLSGTIHLDGFANEFTSSDALFGYNEIVGAPEEPTDDSKWGVNEDLNQIYVT
ncbi:MAG: hypothetical protein IPJ04_05270 [Candidatus Eisenbacteria bacterium]|nr:hypothetical protein [Candidatus Eisenbacteria bacterium]